MDHFTLGIRKILDSPFFYSLYQWLVGTPALHQYYVKKFINPFPNAKVLDIGCGVGGILEYFPDQVEYVGYDLNPKYIASAKKRYKGRGEFICDRVSESMPHPLAGQFDFVLATFLLHHLYDSEAELLFKSAYHHLKSGGVVVTIDPVYIPDQSQVAKYIISKDRGRQVREPEGYKKLINQNFSSVENSVLKNMLRFPYTHFVIRAVK